MHPAEAYLSSLQQIHSTGGGTAEESYYGCLETLLNEIGKTLKPKVRCVGQLQNLGVGEPDFGLFTANQFQRSKDREPTPGQLPERGVVEVKPWKDDSFATSKSAQVSKYWKRYGLVMVTNYCDFVLIGRTHDAKPVRLETFRLAESQVEFLSMLAHPRKAAKENGQRLLDFLQRALLHCAALTRPEDLAWFLASYAREARTRVEKAANLDALVALRTALEDALGMKFEGDKGEHFFQATLVQTLFYGVFSSWVLWAREHPGSKERFNWHEASWTLHVPMIASLFSQIATPARLRPLGVAEVLDWAGLVLNRVEGAEFFKHFEEEQAVQYFYEPFLKAYDPQLRKDLGVWYTPPEIVKYQVERVDSVLRDELGLADGLADDRVIVLDPCCGTGAYLVEALRKIHDTLHQKSGDALVAQRLKKAAMQRVFGFEILPAPFVVSHLQLGLMLRRLGAPLKPDSDERARVYLTNALTGWEPPTEPKKQLPLFPELAQERDAADSIKQKAPILVILGNPPYNAFAGTSPAEEGGLVEVYKEGLTKAVKDGGWGIKKFNLDDLYVRFFRIAERRIIKTGKGVVSYISNFSYLGDPSFVVMRQKFLQEFDKLWFDCMNGDSRETGKLTPEGKPDPSVFSTEQSPVGIRVGTTICIMARKPKRDKKPLVHFKHYWGISKRRDVLASLKEEDFNGTYEIAKPNRTNRYSFRPLAIENDYLQWPGVLDLSAVPPSNGLMEKRGGALIDLDRDALAKRMQAYYDEKIDWETLKDIVDTLSKDAARYDARATRTKVLTNESFENNRLRRYALRPFDSRWCYYSPVRSLWNEPRPSYWTQCWEGNSFFMTRFRSGATPEGSPCFFVPGLSDDHFITPDNSCFPLRLRPELPKHKGNKNQGHFFGEEKAEPTITANLSDKSRAYLAELGIKNPDADAETAGFIWMHALAIGYSPAYLSENADGIRQDWPRIPLPAKKETLLASAKLGQQVAALLDTESPVKGVTSGQIRPELKEIAIISKVDGGSLDPAAGELDLTAGWGHTGKGGVCMPGKGKIVEHKTSDKEQEKRFGAKTLDVYLNDKAYWANIPQSVWDYYIGGYQVIKKWLSYREKTLLGRGLKIEKAEYVTEMTRRIAALILLQQQLDANYRAVKSQTWPWPKRSA